MKAFEIETATTGFLVQQIERDMPQYCHSLRRMCHLNPTLVFVEDHIKHPIDTILQHQYFVV